MIRLKYLFIEGKSKDIKDVLKQLSKQAKTDDVILRLKYNKDSKSIELGFIFVPEEMRGKGLGDKYIKKLLYIADEYDRVVELNVLTSTNKKAELIRYYEKYGFKLYNGSKYLGDMIRKPQ